MSELSLSETLIHSTVRIECFDAAFKASYGTGFFYNFLDNGQDCLPAIVTNKHVFDGAQTAAFHFSVNNGQDAPLYGKRERVIVGDFSRAWMPHPDPSVDLALFPIGYIIELLENRGIKPFYRAFVNDLLPNEDLVNSLSVIEDVYMIGYPNGIWDSSNNIPIVRKGITATPFGINYRDRTEFVIDAACFPGSSGSPVVLINRNAAAEMSGGDIPKMKSALLGVLYAGPERTVTGKIIFKNIPTTAHPFSISRTPINLGFCIKSMRILDFEALLISQIENMPSPPIRTEFM